MGGEPLVGGDLFVRVVEGDAPRAEFGAGPLGLVAGDRRVQPPAGPGVVDGLQGGDRPGGLGRGAAGLAGGCAQLRGFGRVVGGVGAGGPQLRVGAGLHGAVLGGGQVVGDVARRPRLLALIGADPHPELPVGQLGLLGPGVGQVERGVRGPPRRVVLGEPRGRRGPSASAACTGSASSRPVSSRYAAAHDARCSHSVRATASSGGGPRASRGPLRRVGGDPLAEFAAAVVGRGCQRVEPVPGGAGQAGGDEVGVAGQVRAEPVGERAGDALV